MSRQKFSIILVSNMIFPLYFSFFSHNPPFMETVFFIAVIICVVYLSFTLSSSVHRVSVSKNSDRISFAIVRHIFYVFATFFFSTIDFISNIWFQKWHLNLFIKYLIGKIQNLIITWKLFLSESNVGKCSITYSIMFFSDAS